MARVTGPLMSFDASGTIAGAVVFAKWRGRNYVRRHAVPSNPRSVAQLAARSIIAFAGQQWKSIGGVDQATWEAGAESLKISAFNEYIRINARNWRDQFCPSKASPALRVEVPVAPSVVEPAPSGRQMLVAITYSKGADDWGLAICRSLVNTDDPSPSLVVAIVNAQTFLGTYVDGPLEPGTYYYNAFAFSIDGVMSTFPAWGSETIV